MRPLNEIIVRLITQALVVVGGIKSASRVNRISDVAEHSKVMMLPISGGLRHPFVQFCYPGDTTMPARVIKSHFRISGVDAFVGKPKVAQSVIKFVLIDMVNKTRRPFSKVQSQYDRMGADLGVKQRTCFVPDAVNRCESILPGISSVPNRTVVFSRLLAGCEKIRYSWKPNKPTSREVGPKKFLNSIDGRKRFFHVVSSFACGIIVYDKQRGQAI